MIRKINPVKKMKEEGGGVTIVEASYLYPIAFLLVFFFISLSFLLWEGGHRESKVVEEVQQATNSPLFHDPSAIPVLGEEGMEWKISGFFRPRMKVEAGRPIKRVLPFRYFRLGERTEVKTRSFLNWTSSANTMWKYLAIRAWMKSGK